MAGTRMAVGCDRGRESPPWLTGAVRRGCICAAGAVSTYARQDPTGGGPPYRVLRGESPQEHGIYLGEISFVLFFGPRLDTHK